MQLIKKLFVLTVNVPLYFFSCLIPKKKGLIVFGAWFGTKYADNSKYLYEYSRIYGGSVKPIWMARDRNLLRKLRESGHKAHHSYSPFGYYYSARASFAFVSTSWSDLNKYIPNKRTINLWHGTPLKRIVYDNLIQPSNDSNHRIIKKYLLPFYRTQSDYFRYIAGSDLEASLVISAFRTEANKVLVTGLPRNDSLINIENSNVGVNVLYLPTHRGEGKDNFVADILSGLDLIEKCLEANGCILTIKLHPYHDEFVPVVTSKTINFIKSNAFDDLYSSVHNFDILVTDYSSFFFDFLLTSKPIIFAPFDIERYNSTDREFYFDYETTVPGPICKNWPEVMNWIKHFIRDPSLFSSERSSALLKFHKYTDGKNSARIMQALNL